MDLATVAYEFETLTVDNTVGGVGLTASEYTPTTGNPARRVVLGPLESGQIRYQYHPSAAPDATTGHLLEIGQTVVLEGHDNIRTFRAIRTGATNGSLPVTYER
jgi:hypothetical protein